MIEFKKNKSQTSLVNNFNKTKHKSDLYQSYVFLSIIVFSSAYIFQSILLIELQFYIILSGGTQLYWTFAEL